MMKTVQQILVSKAGVIGMMGLLAMAFTSCTRDRYYGSDSPYYGSNYVVSNTPVAYLSVIDATPDPQGLNFFLDQNQANNRPVYYGSGLDYINAYTGKRTATFSVASTIRTTIKTDTITLKANTYYSLYLANLITKPDYLFVTDSLSKPATGMASVRFVDVSTDAPAVDLGIKGKTTLIGKNKSYKGYTSFIPIKGDTTYTVEVRPTGTSNVLVSISNLYLHKGGIYTVWLHGLSAATDYTRLTADIQNNGYYY